MKSLVHEIHRRSLWQVLGIYAAAAWIVLQIVDVIGNNFGLPEWVAPAALVLLLLGLPVVLATAFVQEGVGRAGSSYPRDRTAASGADGADPASPEPTVPAPVASGRHRLLTWRNAVIGGGAAFALLGIATAGYLFMRTAGIGPAGTLVAAGVLEEGAKVVLADFESDDAGLAEVVTGALRIDLLQSPTIRIVEQSELEGALRRMQRDDDTPITANVARELAAREGYGAAIAGEIGPLGSGYVLTARIMGGDDWTSLAAFRETARSEDDLIDAIEALSRNIRDKSGESLRTIRNAPPLEQVTTSSLEALRLYTRGEILEDSDRPAAVDLYERAVGIDPEFGMAYRKIGVALGNMGIRRADEIAALTRAFDLRDRLPAAEQHLAEAYYQSAVGGDRDAAVRAYERLLDMDADNPAGLNNLANIYMDRGRLEDAEALLERAVSGEAFMVGFSNLADVRFSLGRVDDAEAALEAGAALLPEAESELENRRVRLRTSAADYEGAEAAATAYGERFRSRTDRVTHAYQQAVLHAIRGELAAAEDRLRRVGGVPAYFAHPMLVARDRADVSLVKGDSATAVRILLDAHGANRDSLSAGDRIYGWWLPTLLEAGGRDRAEALYEEWRREVPDAELSMGGHDARREMEARFAFARGDLEESIRLWESYERECPGVCAIVAALGLARLHEARGDTGAAIAEYERFLDDRLWRRWLYDLAHRGPVLERLGQLYDAQGDLENAAKYLAMFVELWADADEELQPRVRAAQARLEEILREIR